MKKWQTGISGILAFLLFFHIGIPVWAADREEPLPTFENTDGMIIDLIYYYEQEDGSEQIIQKQERTIIPAGISAVTVELQQRLLPEGYALKEAKDIPLEESTLEVKIPLQKLSAGLPQPEEKPTEPEGKPTEPEGKPTEPGGKPTEPEEKPTEPEEKPTEPEEKPTEPEEKPTEPEEKPTEPEEKPTVPQGKPEKPQKPGPKPDPTNPQTGDPIFVPLSASILSGTVLILLFKTTVPKKND